MAFQEVASLDAEVTVALGKRDKKTGKAYPKEAEGYYLGSRTVQSKRGDSKLHFLSTQNGNLGVWGTTDLNRKLAQVTPGTMVKITSTGTKPTPNGDMYTYKVAQDKANTIEVALSADDAAPAEDNNTDEYETSSNENEDSDDEEYEAPGAVVAQLSAAERAAKVQALLKGKGKTK